MEAEAIQQLDLQSQMLRREYQAIQIHFLQALQTIEIQKQMLLKGKDGDWRLPSHSHFRVLIMEEIERILKKHQLPTQKPIVSAIESKLFLNASSLGEYIEYLTLSNRVIEALRS